MYFIFDRHYDCEQSVITGTLIDHQSIYFDTLSHMRSIFLLSGQTVFVVEHCYLIKQCILS